MTDKEVEFTLDELRTMGSWCNFIKERLCNQGKLAEALEYQIIQDKLELIIKEVEKRNKNEQTD